MPNQRREDKKYIGVWFTPNEEARLQALADKLTDGNRAELLRKWLADSVKELPASKRKSKK